MVTQEFPNGFTSWYETHYEISSFISAMLSQDEKGGEDTIIYQTQLNGGTPMIWELAASWAAEFEALHTGEVWYDKDFYDTVEAFCIAKNKQQL